jgi:hypothetical protein
MTGAAWLLLGLGAAGAAYSIYLGQHFYRHRERRRIDRRGSLRSPESDGGDRREGRDRRQP